MQPKIIKNDTLYITGLTGDGAKTGEVWNEFDSKYNDDPFQKTNENGYEIRFYNSEKPTIQGKDVHVGFASENAIADGSDFETVTIPATEYAVFEVLVANGYDSGNAEMDKWLADNSAQYKPLLIDGVGFIVECYNEKFKDGNKPDSIVEMWVPVYRLCQSCAMPMTKPEKFGTEADGRLNRNYCCYCYADGDFTTKQTLEEAVEGNIQFWREENDKSDDEARARIMEVFPKLKRWAISAEDAK